MHDMPYDPRPVARAKDPTALRRFRLERVGEPCEICEARQGTEVHHRVFRSQGGDDVEENFVLVCVDCHRGIHDGTVRRP